MREAGRLLARALFCACAQSTLQRGKPRGGERTERCGTTEANRVQARISGALPRPQDGGRVRSSLVLAPPGPGAFTLIAPEHRPVTPAALRGTRKRLSIRSMFYLGHHHSCRRDGTTPCGHTRGHTTMRTTAATAHLAPCLATGPVHFETPLLPRPFFAGPFRHPGGESYYLIFI